MNLPTIEDQLWKDIIEEKKAIKFDFIAFNLFMGRVKVTMSRNPEKSAELAQELYELFAKNSGSPIVQKDIEKLK